MLVVRCNVFLYQVVLFFGIDELYDLSAPSANTCFGQRTICLPSSWSWGIISRAIWERFFGWKTAQPARIYASQPRSDELPAHIIDPRSLRTSCAVHARRTDCNVIGMGMTWTGSMLKGNSITAFIYGRRVEQMYVCKHGDFSPPV